MYHIEVSRKFPKITKNDQVQDVLELFFTKKYSLLYILDLTFSNLKWQKLIENREDNSYRIDCNRKINKTGLFNKFYFYLVIIFLLYNFGKFLLILTW